MNLLIAWILLMLPFVYLLGALLSTFVEPVDSKDGNRFHSTNVLISFLIWWGIYFLI